MNNAEEIKEMKRFDWFIVKLAIRQEALICFLILIAAYLFKRYFLLIIATMGEVTHNEQFVFLLSQWFQRHSIIILSVLSFKGILTLKKYKTQKII